MSNLIGQSFGRYQILEQLGEGGMANVYKAYDTRLERFVAIKVIRMEQFAPGMLEQVLKRFEREAKALAQLSHPNIVRVFDSGDFEGAPYLVMEYLPSGNLKQHLGSPMPWQQALNILLPIANALAYAHEHNIIHRDIKAANILLTENGRPMLTDFGIAKILESNATATLTGVGMSLGTPEYMAPEQWKGRASPQSDIYSLGVVLYELVSGRKPYTADTPVAIMLKQMNDPLPRPSLFVMGLPEGLENVLLKAMAKQPEYRYQSMSEFAAALEKLSSGQTLASGAMEASLQSDRTILAGGGQTPEASSLAPGFPASGGNPPAGQVPEIPYPAQEQPQRSIRWGLWIPVAVLVVLLCGGGLLGTGLIMKGLNSRVPTSVPATKTVPSEPAISPMQAPVKPPLVPPTPTQTPTQTPTPVPAEIKVLWDISHGPRASQEGASYTPDGLYKSLATALASQNFIITSGDLSSINNYDIVVLSAASATKMVYTTLEADEIEKFVRSGHGLLILSDIPGFGNLADSVGLRFSIGMEILTTDGPVSYSNEPFFSGVSSVQFLFGGGTFQVGSPSQTAAVDKGGNPVIAFCECDPGRVMAIGDSNLWDNRGITLGNNQSFAINVFRWLAKLSP